MIDVDEAYKRLFAHLRPGPVVELALGDAIFRTLAEPVCCDVDYPPFDRSVMDGYAVRVEDIRDTPVALRVSGRIAAGTTVRRSLGRGEAMQINTGAPMPPGADAVVRVESTEPSSDGATVLVRESVSASTFITPRATYVTAGQVVLDRGQRLTPLAVGAAAAAGAARVKVYARPTVAILATGDELVDVDRKPTGAQIRNSNPWLLEALVRAAQAKPVVLGVARDDRAILREKISDGLRYDVLCVTGGVSKGSMDFVPEVLEGCGVTFRIRGMAIKPGRPTLFGTMPDATAVFALPGNPGSAFTGFELLVAPALAALEGRVGAVPSTVRAVLCGTIKATSVRRTYVPSRLRTGGDGELEVEPLPWHGSGDTFGLATANALVMRPPESPAAMEGDFVSTLPLARV